MRTAAVYRTNVSILIAFLNVAIGVGLCSAEDRPRFTQLLPGDTMLMVRVTDAKALKEDWAETTIGKLAKDEQVQPILGGIVRNDC